MHRNNEFVGIEILVVDGDPSVRKGLSDLFTEMGFIPCVTGDVEEGVEMIRTKFFAVVLCDLDTPITEGGIVVVEACVEHSPATTPIVLTSRKGWDAAVAAFRAGATEILIKAPEQIEYLKERVGRAAKEWHRQRNRDELLLQMSEVHDDFLKRMREMYKVVVDIQDRLQGRDIMASFQLPECRVLVVDESPTLYEEISKAFENRDDGWVFSQVQSGGEALDIGGREKYHVALIKDQLPDLPGSMVISTLRAQSPETIYLNYGNPGEPGAKVEVKEAERAIPLVEDFTETAQLAGKLDEIRDAFKSKAQERRYLQSFRTNQFDFLKKFAEINKAVEKAKREMDERRSG
jgi:DNA-binding NtrC family response regulator